MAEATLRVLRGDQQAGSPTDYKVPIAPGMVVLDALHYIQGHLAPDLAVRWNCKAGKCGSCSCEVNGRPRLTCKTRMDSLPTDEPITVNPIRSFPVIKDLVTDVSWNYNITKCCTEVCPEEIHITDNAIIPLKERVVDEYYDPVLKLVKKIFGSE